MEMDIANDENVQSKKFIDVAFEAKHAKGERSH